MTKNNQAIQRISTFKTLDAFRGFAALWVVMRHSCDRWIGDGNMSYLSNPIYSFGMRGQIGVTLFFLISGYCITAAGFGALASGKTVSRFGYERLRRIYPPYLAALVLATVSLLAIHFASAHHFIGRVNHPAILTASPSYWLANIFLVQQEFRITPVDVVYWSLCYEVAFYLIVALFLAISKWIAARRGLTAGTIFLVSAFGVSTAITVSWMLFGGREIFPFDQWHQFSIGALLFFLMELKPKTFAGYSKKLSWMVGSNALIVSILVFLYALLKNVEATGYDNPSSRVRSVVALLFALALYGLRRVDDLVALHPLMKPLVWLGSFSYGMYLVHDVFLPYVDILSRKAGLNHSLYIVAFMLQIAVSVVVGRLFYLLVERHFISKRQVRRLTEEHLG